MSSTTAHKFDLKTYKIVYRSRWLRRSTETVYASRMHVRDDGIVVFYRYDAAHSTIGCQICSLQQGSWQSVREEETT